MFEIFSMVFDFFARIKLPLIGTEFYISPAQVIVVSVITIIVFHIIVSFFNR